MKNHFVGLLFVLFTCFILGTKVTYANKTTSPVRLIIDTDAGFDVDDIGAITVANALEDLGEVEIIAISHTNGYTKGIGAVSTIMNFYGRNDVPLGAYKGPWARNATYGNNTADKYISDLTNNWPSPIKNSTEVLTSVQTYRKALVNSPDHSVHIASIGITTNMRDLVLSPPDQYSPLNGHDLIALKVNLIVWMDGMYNFGCAEHDTFDWLGSDTGCHGSAKLAVENWPSTVKQIFSPVGADVLHGAWLNGCAGKDDPSRRAFQDWGVGGTGRSSWDPIAVMIAVRGADAINCKEIDLGGYMAVDETGKETWNYDSNNKSYYMYNQSRIEYSGDDPQLAISFKLNELLCKPVGPFSTTDWVLGLGENCYEDHGATDLDDGNPIGIMSLDECKEKCLDLGKEECTGITVTPALSDEEDDKISCYRRHDVVFGTCDYDTKFNTYIRKTWVPALGFNCYEGHGAIDIDGKNYIAIGTVSDCKMKCEKTEDCTGIVFYMEDDDSGIGKCYRKSQIELNKCDHETKHFDVYLRSINL